MEIITVIITFLEKHIKWGYLLALICIGVSFWLGTQYANNVHSKVEADLILTHAKEITGYHDSAIAAKLEAHDAISEYECKLFYKDRTIDSLQNIIKSMEDESKNRHQ